MNTPEAISRDFAEAISDRDRPAAVACFSVEGRLLTPDGTEVTGRGPIGEVLEQLFLTHPLVLAQAGRTIVADSAALAAQCWTTGFQTADKSLSQEVHTSTLLLGKISATWRVLVAAPWGF
ncbi:MAG TPA: hypothetical protein VEW07_08330 [Solirubrobacterales bacterium]|nr:hypothetical protein [Solirubrobacterales bacterium]